QEIRTRDAVIQQKTGRPVQFELTADVKASLLAWLERRVCTIDDFAVVGLIMLITSTRQYARLIFTAQPNRSDQLIDQSG
ncbi:hypothetical protein ACC715_37330, partial [Rhizobium ruizarguesonis]